MIAAKYFCGLDSQNKCQSITRNCQLLHSADIAEFCSMRMKLGIPNFSDCYINGIYDSGVFPIVVLECRLSSSRGNIYVRRRRNNNVKLAVLLPQQWLSSALFQSYPDQQAMQVCSCKYENAKSLLKLENIFYSLEQEVELGFV